MYAQHPINKKPIRILRSEVQIFQDCKTLVHIQANSATSPKWCRFNTIVSCADALPVLAPLRPHYVVLKDELDDDDLKAWVQFFASEEKPRIVFLSDVVAKQLGSSICTSMPIICINEFHDLYSFIESRLSHSNHLIEVLSAIGILLRVHKIIVDTSQARQNDFGTLLKKHECEVLYENLQNLDIIPKNVLIQQYFHHKLSRRMREIKECFFRNLQNPYIDEIHFLNEQEYPEILINTKVRQYVIGRRIRYADVFSHIKKNIEKNCICLISNSDIYFDSTIRELWNIDMHNKFLALLRWDDPNMPQIRDSDRKESVIFGPRPDSQDTWIVHSADVTFDESHDDFDIEFGKPGCDNAITLSMLKRKFLVTNPAFSIKTHHLHISAVREYDMKDIVYRPIFLYVDPTAIATSSIKNDLNEYCLPVMNTPLDIVKKRKIKSIDTEFAKKVCSKLRQEKRWIYSESEDNEFVEPAHSINKLYKFNNTFSSATGLTYGPHHVNIGSNEIWQQLFNESTTRITDNTLYVPSMLSIPLSRKIAENLPLWCIYYLARVLEVKKHLQSLSISNSAEFIAPITPFVGEFLTNLAWNKAGFDSKKINLIHYHDDMQYYCDEIFALAPVIRFVTASQIALLRSILPLAVEAPKEKIVVISVGQDKQICNRALAITLQETVFSGWRVHIIGEKSSPKEIIRLLQNANIFIGQLDRKWFGLCYLWCMRAGSKVIEIINDDKPSGEIIHLAGISDIEYNMVSEDSASLVDDIRQTLLLAETSVNTREGSKPVIYIPVNQDPFHVRTNDSFIEMVNIWRDRGLCDTIETTVTPYIWWKHVGDILLYDRPTLRWFNSNVEYKRGLFANCSPPENDKNNLVWSYWPRHPAALETFLAQNSTVTYENRDIESIFLGKSENGVQLKKRTEHDWSVISKWSMPVDAEPDKYEYSQEEYLALLARSKFGLCLGGYGPKCNREIEYFALGVVPVCTSNVDMKNYIDPPQENIHYLRVSDPADFKKQIGEISEERWKQMSAEGRKWWKQNASAEGLFNLTVKMLA